MSGISLKQSADKIAWNQNNINIIMRHINWQPSLGYWPGSLSCHQVFATHLMIGHPYMKSTDARIWNDCRDLTWRWSTRMLVLAMYARLICPFVIITTQHMKHCTNMIPMINPFFVKHIKYFVNTTTKHLNLKSRQNTLWKQVVIKRLYQQNLNNTLSTPRTWINTTCFHSV